MNKNKNKEKGFTLIELLIVIVILGILAAVTVFAVTGITDQGQADACDIEERILVGASEAYYAQNGSAYAITKAELDQQLTPGATDWTVRFAATWDTGTTQTGANAGDDAPTFDGQAACD